MNSFYFSDYSDLELKMKREVMREFAVFANTREFPDRDEEVIAYFEERLKHIEQEIERRETMDSNHQTRLYHGD